MMTQTILPLAKELIALQSTAENKQALERSLTAVLSQVKGYTVERFERNGIKSALIYNTKQRPQKFKIILNGHVDVTPGKKYQYTPIVKQNKLFGVGALDMKANLACLVAVFTQVANKVSYPLALQVVTDEEVGGENGTKYQIEQGVRADFVLAGETTDFNIVNKAKGVLWLKIATKGKTAHGAYPWRGRNAIWRMHAFLSKLEEKYKVPKEEAWVTTINVAKIETTNTAFNKIPDDCQVLLDIRYIPQDARNIVGDIKKLLPSGFTVQIVANEPALVTDEENHYVKKLQRIAKQVTRKNIVPYGAQGTSDARHYARVGCSGIEFGAIGGGIGSDNEWIDIKSLETYSQILTKFLLSLES